MIPSLKKSTNLLRKSSKFLVSLSNTYSINKKKDYSYHGNQDSKGYNNFWKKNSFVIASALLTGFGLYFSNKVWMKEQEPQNNYIVYLNDASEIQHLGLQGHALVWYQALNNPIIDEEVEKILNIFVQKRSQTINIPFKIVIDKTQKAQQNTDQSNYYKKSCELVVIKPDSIKPIELNKFLNYKGTSIQQNQYSLLFNRIAIQLNQVIEINLSNVREMMNNLTNRSSQAWVLMAAHSPDPKDYRRSKKKFKQFLKQKQSFGQHVQKAMVTDEQTLRILGIDPERAKPSQMFILAPPSQNLPPNTHKTNIFGNKYHVLTAWQISKFIFPPYLQKSHSDSLYLRVAVDANQNVAQQLKNIYRTLRELPEESELKTLPKYLIFQKDHTNKRAITLSLQKNNFDEIVAIYEKTTRHSNDQKKKLLLGSHKWKFPANQQIGVKELVNWFNRVKSGEQKQTFQSQNRIIQASEVPILQFNSTRITGEQYYESISSNPQKPKVVFHFSPHCFSCKKFKHHFQDFAKQKRNEYDFYRINNDENKTDSAQNFNSTPIFVVYKTNPINNKIYMYQYKNTIFTKKVFGDFLDVTRDIKFLEEDELNKSVEDRRKSDSLLKQFIAEGACHTQ